MSDPNAAPPAGDLAVDQKIADMVTGAVKSHLGRVLPSALAEHLTPHLTAFETKLAAMLKAPAAPEAGKGASAPNPEIEELRAEVKREKEARITEKRQAREDRAHGDLMATLTGKVRPEAVKDVADLLFHARKVVKVGADGNVTMRVGDADYPLVEGAAEWLKTKDAALYVPAPAPAKAGMRFPGMPRPAQARQPQASGQQPPVQPGGARPDPMQKTLEDLRAKGMQV